MHIPRLRYLGIIGLVCLTGCATAAQRQYQAIVANNRVVAAEAKNCILSVYNDPAAAPIRAHTPLDAKDIALANITDSSYATPQEIAAITAIDPRRRVCQKEILEGFSRSVPGMVPILARGYSATEDDLARLIQHQITWGDLNRRRRDRYVEILAATQEEAQRITSNLEREHEAELARRRAAANALAQWAQTQQVINAMNRPTMTNCLSSGPMTNCTTY